MPLWDTLYRWLCHHGTPLDVDGYIISENSKGPKVQTLGSKGPKGPKFKMATKVNKTTSAIAETNYFQNSHSMFIKPTVFLVRSVVGDGISITVY